MSLRLNFKRYAEKLLPFYRTNAEDHLLSASYADDNDDDTDGTKVKSDNNEKEGDFKNKSTALLENLNTLDRISRNSNSNSKSKLLMIKSLATVFLFLNNNNNKIKNKNHQTINNKRNLVKPFKFELVQADIEKRDWILEKTIQFKLFTETSATVGQSNNNNNSTLDQQEDSISLEVSALSSNNLILIVLSFILSSASA